MTTASVALLAIAGPLGSLGLIGLIRVERWAKWLALLGANLALVAALFGLLVLTTTTDSNNAAVDEGLRPTALAQVTLPGLPGLPLRLIVEPTTVLLSLVVAVVNLAVLLYAVGYMREEKGQRRFFAQMSFFVAAMQLLVFAGDWLLVLAAWELIGLASYLLIGFWYERKGVKQAATRAFLTTRAADFGLYVAVFALIGGAGTSEIGRTLNLSGPMATVAGLGLLLAAMGKSAQLPFQGWLQDAMAGPTPVSALLHSATLVAAGPILLLRAYPLLSPTVLVITGTVGGLTALALGLMALAEGDLKRMLAASTSSQLGFMFLAIGVGSPGAATLHLVTHAAMKSALFLGAGVFQHAYRTTSFEDIRAAGGGRRYGLAFGGFTLAGLALVGLPPLAGFWSKEAIVAASFNTTNGYASWFGLLALLGTLVTGLYIGRALRLLWPPASLYDNENSNNENKAGEKPGTDGWMLTGLLSLASLTALLGLAVEPISSFLNVTLSGNSLSLGLSLVAALGGLAWGWWWLGRLWSRVWPGLRLAQSGFRLAGGFDQLVVQPVLMVANWISRADQKLHALVLLVGQAGLALARLVGRVDGLIHRIVGLVGYTGLQLARLARRTDEQGIDRLIGVLVKETQALGRRVRGLQSGLIHRELLLTGGAVILVLAVILLSR